MSVRSAEASKGWFGAVEAVGYRSGVVMEWDGVEKVCWHVREGQRAQRSAPSVPCSAAAGTNVGYHPVLDMPVCTLVFFVFCTFMCE